MPGLPMRLKTANGVWLAGTALLQRLERLGGIDVVAEVDRLAVPVLPDMGERDVDARAGRPCPPVPRPEDDEPIARGEELLGLRIGDVEVLGDRGQELEHLCDPT